MPRKKKGSFGSSFDDFLAEEGILEACEEQAIKQILADQIIAAMKKDRLTKSAMAARMHTSRRALDRLLDPKNTGVTLHTLQRAAVAVGRQLRLELMSDFPGMHQKGRALGNLRTGVDPSRRS